MVNYKIAWLVVAGLILTGGMTYGQSDACPVNINFSAGDLTNWSAVTGLIGGASQSYPKPNNGAVAISEYSLSTTGISVIRVSTKDKFGGFPTIPVINGYQYSNSVLLGSTSTSHDLNRGNDRNPGGFMRAITYTIDVPAGSVAEPYTICYAYALVLENGTHNSSDQPLFKATLQTPDGVISCASPKYYLPTLNNAHNGGGPGGGGSFGTGATLDSAAAKANGFVNSPELFLSYSGQNNNGGTWLRDVWTKDWTEVTVDLAPYRGRQVTLTFEADNCVPGAHFAYAYVALRNTCSAPQISGFTTACTNNGTVYTIPGLPDASYYWTVPASWTIISGGNTNTITVRPGENGGTVAVRQVNSCADLRATLPVTTSPSTLAGQAGNNQTVCAGVNNSTITLAGNRGSVVDWLSSADGIHWTSLGVSGNQYNAGNLMSTTQYAALVQNGEACSIDTSGAALITVDPRTVGGSLSPSSIDVCEGQTIFPSLRLTDNTGSVENWQQSPDSISWSSLSPVYQQPTYSPPSVRATNFYRVIVKSGVCPTDTSAVAAIRFYDVLFPEAVASPASLFVCNGQPFQLSATISTGTKYTWSTTPPPLPVSSGIVSGLPQLTTINLRLLVSSDAVLTVYNEGCPNPLNDTVSVTVAPPVIVSAGNDTSVVVGQSLQLNASVNNGDEGTHFRWSPSTGLNNALINDPVAVYNRSDPAYIPYTITATTADGCLGSDTMTVRIFKTLADIFVPNAFTPNNDGRNDVMRPEYAGIGKLNFFRIYNRWGQLVFNTSDMGKGWDGLFRGSLQPTDSYVYMVQGIDYTGRTINKKGSLILIR